MNRKTITLIGCIITIFPFILMVTQVFIDGYYGSMLDKLLSD